MQSTSAGQVRGYTAENDQVVDESTPASISARFYRPVNDGVFLGVIDPRDGPVQR